MGIIVYCKYCGGIVDKQDTHCKYCNNEITEEDISEDTYKLKSSAVKTNTNYCIHCGQKIDFKDDYCSNCGEKIDRFSTNELEKPVLNSFNFKNRILNILKGIIGIISILITLDIYIDCQYYYPIIAANPFLFLPIILPAVLIVIPFEKIKNNKLLSVISLIIVLAISGYHYKYIQDNPVERIFIDQYMHINHYANVNACFKALTIVFILNLICAIIYLFQQKWSLTNIIDNLNCLYSKMYLL